MRHIVTRPAQCMIYVHCLIDRFQEIVLLIVQYKYEKSVPEDKRLKTQKIMRYWIYYST